VVGCGAVARWTCNLIFLQAQVDTRVDPSFLVSVAAALFMFNADVDDEGLATKGDIDDGGECGEDLLSVVPWVSYKRECEMGDRFNKKRPTADRMRNSLFPCILASKIAFRE